MSNPTQVPVRRVRTISAHSGAASVAEAPPVDAESAEAYGAYEGYEGYEGQDGYEEYDQYEEPQRTGLFSSPARALALGGSVLALLLVFAVAIFIANGRNPHPIPPSVTAGDTEVPVISNISQNGALSTGSVPPNFEWTDSQGNTVSLASLKGKSVWINFWGTWCPPCRAEMPAMEKVYSKHKDDLVILGVSMAPRDDPGVVSEFLKQNRYSWTFIHDSDQELAMRYQAGSIPMSYFIGPDGTVRAASMGAIPENLMENFIAQAKQ
ncbi:MAG: TlpA family protein disulfide reductase [Chloroflexota bacterium]|nr:TlpA family protein disulfide reductase [Chloroflexota bacterium]